MRTIVGRGRGGRWERNEKKPRGESHQDLSKTLLKAGPEKRQETLKRFIKGQNKKGPTTRCPQNKERLDF